MKRINLGKSSSGEQVYIDLETLVSTRMLVTASSGGGKSETLRRILEEASEYIQCIVIDPEGEFSTLREKRPFVLVGEGGETVADVRTAALVATRLLELNASAVCDLYEMKVHDRHEWVKRFLDSMVHAPKSLWHPVLVVIDEAHSFAPEKGYSESVATGSVIDIANLGRKRGFCLIAATQRLSKLSKNVTEPLQNYLVGRTTFDDQSRAAATFKVAPGAATREFSLELERLKDGEFIGRGRAITGDMLKIQVARGMTRPPKTGTAMAGIVTPTPEAIKSLLPKLADLPQEAEKKAKTEDDLRREVVVAQRRIRELEMAKPADDGEVKVLKDTIAQLQQEAAGLELSETMLRQKLEKAAVAAQTLVDILASTIDPLPRAPLPYVPKPVTSVPRPVTLRAANSGDVNLRAGARKMLAVLVQWSPSGRTEAQVAAQVQMKRTGGAWGAYKSDLKNAGCIEIRDGLWFATEAGCQFLGADVPQMPATTAEVVDLWAGKLRKGAREMLDVLVRHKGRVIARTALGEQVGMESSGGTFGAYLSDLKQAGLIEVTSQGINANRETLML